MLNLRIMFFQPHMQVARFYSESYRFRKRHWCLDLFYPHLAQTRPPPVRLGQQVTCLHSAVHDQNQDHSSEYVEVHIEPTVCL